MKKAKKQKHNLRKELETYEKQGISLWLDGVPSTPKEIQKAHRVAEEGCYMRDYVHDDHGCLTRLEFDSVRND